MSTPDGRISSGHADESDSEFEATPVPLLECESGVSFVRSCPARHQWNITLRSSLDRSIHKTLGGRVLTSEQVLGQLLHYLHLQQVAMLRELCSEVNMYITNFFKPHGVYIGHFNSHALNTGLTTSKFLETFLRRAIGNAKALFIDLTATAMESHQELIRDAWNCRVSGRIVSLGVIDPSRMIRPQLIDHNLRSWIAKRPGNSYLALARLRQNKIIGPTGLSLDEPAPPRWVTEILENSAHASLTLPILAELDLSSELWPSKATTSSEKWSTASISDSFCPKLLALSHTMDASLDTAEKIMMSYYGPSDVLWSNSEGYMHIPLRGLNESTCPHLTNLPLLTATWADRSQGDTWTWRIMPTGRCDEIEQGHTAKELMESFRKSSMPIRGLAIHCPMTIPENLEIALEVMQHEVIELYYHGLPIEIRGGFPSLQRLTLTYPGHFPPFLLKCPALKHLDMSIEGYSSLLNYAITNHIDITRLLVFQPKLSKSLRLSTLPEDDELEAVATVIRRLSISNVICLVSAQTTNISKVIKLRSMAYRPDYHPVHIAFAHLPFATREETRVLKALLTCSSDEILFAPPGRKSVRPRSLAEVSERELELWSNTWEELTTCMPAGPWSYWGGASETAIGVLPAASPWLSHLISTNRLADAFEFLPSLTALPLLNFKLYSPLRNEVRTFSCPFKITDT